MRKIILFVAALVLVVPTNAQFFNRLVDAAKQSAENAVQRQVEQKVEEGVEKIFNPETGEYEEVKRDEPQEVEEQAKPQKPQGWTCPKCGAQGQTGKFCTECGAKKPEAGNATPSPKKTLESSYAKSDFVPGDEIFFDTIVHLVGGEEEIQEHNNLLFDDMEVYDRKNVGSPKTIRMEDIERIKGTGAFFARKFDIRVDRAVVEYYYKKIMEE